MKNNYSHLGITGSESKIRDMILQAKTDDFNLVEIVAYKTTRESAITMRCLMHEEEETRTWDSWSRMFSSIKKGQNIVRRPKCCARRRNVNFDTSKYDWERFHRDKYLEVKNQDWPSQGKKPVAKTLCIFVHSDLFLAGNED